MGLVRAGGELGRPCTPPLWHATLLGGGLGRAKVRQGRVAWELGVGSWELVRQQRPFSGPQVQHRHRRMQTNAPAPVPLDRAVIGRALSHPHRSAAQVWSPYPSNSIFTTSMVLTAPAVNLTQSLLWDSFNQSTPLTIGRESQLGKKKPSSTALRLQHGNRSIEHPPTVVRPRTLHTISCSLPLRDPPIRSHQ